MPTTFADERTLLIVVGDHQPAPLITGEDAGRDVPIHVIAGDPALLEPFRDWGLAAGMRPARRAARAHGPLSRLAARDVQRHRAANLRSLQSGRS